MAMTFSIPEELEYSSPDQILEIHKNPGFGVHFTDHMAIIDWTLDGGWGEARIAPYQPMEVNPASAVFHYAQEVFEGLKAYRRADGSIWLFRAERNAARLKNSAKRLALPQLPEEDFIQACELLTKIDQIWVPDANEQSLYLRPFLIANEDFLGVRPAHAARFAVIASPVGAYFSGGVKPVDIWVETELSRVSYGGTGDAKCGGNYAASLRAEVIAGEHGCSQVMFVDNASHVFVEELGGMNFFMVTADRKLVTPNLNGNILPGVTRDSLICLAPDFGVEPVERPIKIDEVLSGISDGSITELFACGTAAVITPIGSLHTKSGRYAPATLSTEVTLALRNRLLDIQYGRFPDTFGWTSEAVPAN